jgi:hypothetical protein
MLFPLACAVDRSYRRNKKLSNRAIPLIVRLWSIHPQYLDAKGLVALWREALLAQKVLAGRTKGYRNHPQLVRFKASPDPMAAIGTYLHCVHEESLRRSYKFDVDKVGRVELKLQLEVTSGQVAYEMQHLLGKLKVRDPLRYETVQAITTPEPHPLFRIVGGEIAVWEITS